MGRLLREAKRDRQGRADDIGAPVTAATMPANKDKNWAGPLFKMSGMRDPSETRGRRKALVKEATYKSQRAFWELTTHISEELNKIREFRGSSDVARRLLRRPEYAHLAERTLRRDVAKVFEASELIEVIIDLSVKVFTEKISSACHAPELFALQQRLQKIVGQQIIDGQLSVSDGL
jgi:hypothetical protein